MIHLWFALHCRGWFTAAALLLPRLVLVTPHGYLHAVTHRLRLRLQVAPHTFTRTFTRSCRWVVTFCVAVTLHTVLPHRFTFATLHTHGCQHAHRATTRFITTPRLCTVAVCTRGSVYRAAFVLPAMPRLLIWFLPPTLPVWLRSSPFFGSCRTRSLPLPGYLDILHLVTPAHTRLHTPYAVPARSAGSLHTALPALVVTVAVAVHTYAQLFPRFGLPHTLPPRLFRDIAGCYYIYGSPHCRSFYGCLPHVYGSYRGCVLCVWLCHCGSFLRLRLPRLPGYHIAVGCYAVRFRLLPRLHVTPTVTYAYRTAVMPQLPVARFTFTYAATRSGYRSTRSTTVLVVTV